MKKTLSIIIFVIFAFGVGYYLYDTYAMKEGGNTQHTPGGKLAGTTWVMKTFNGQGPDIPEGRLVVSFDENQINGRICNIYNGKYLSNGITLVAKDLISTKMACIGNVGTIENAFFEGLRNGFQYKIEANTLELMDIVTSARFGFVASSTPR